MTFVHGLFTPWAFFPSTGLTFTTDATTCCLYTALVIETCALTLQTQKVAINPTLHNEDAFNEDTLTNFPIPLLLTGNHTLCLYRLFGRLAKLC